MTVLKFAAINGFAFGSEPFIWVAFMQVPIRKSSEKTSFNRGWFFLQDNNEMARTMIKNEVLTTGENEFFIAVKYCNF